MDGSIFVRDGMSDLLSGYSLEITARDAANLNRALVGLQLPSAVFVPWLPNETDEQRIAMATALREAGHEPVIHIPARRVADAGALERFLTVLGKRAGVTRLLLVGGDAAVPAGPFASVLPIIESGMLEAAGIRAVGMAGHPEGHPAVADVVLWQALQEKADALLRRSIGAEIVTQFSFDAAAVLRWLTQLRQRGIMLPVAIGIPGPAGIRTLMRYAALCGVGASASAVAKYGFSLTRLIGKAGPGAFLSQLTTGLDPAITGIVRAHLYPFGGLEDTAAWLRGIRT